MSDATRSEYNPGRFLSMVMSASYIGYAGGRKSIRTEKYKLPKYLPPFRDSGFKREYGSERKATGPKIEHKAQKK